MEKHDQEFITSLIDYCNDRLELISEFDTLADNFAALFACHERMSAALPAVNSTPVSDERSGSDADESGAREDNAPVLNDKGEELTGAALEANRVISAILDQYKKKTAARSNNSGKAKAKSKARDAYADSSAKGKGNGKVNVNGKGKGMATGNAHEAGAKGSNGHSGGQADKAHAQDKGKAKGSARPFAVSLDEVSHPESVYADYYEFAGIFTETKDKEQLFGEFLNPESEDHDTLFENIGIFTHVQTAALNRQVIKVNEGASRYCDLNNLLNTCDVLSSLPCWNVILDLSALKDCGPVQGMMFSRLTLVRPDKAEQPFTSAAADEAFFLEEPALALLIDGTWESIGMGALLDNDRTVSDLVRELASCISNWTYKEGDLPTLYEREQLPEPDWDETEHIIDPALSKDRLATALYHAFRYLVHVITHTEQLKDEKGNTALPSNYSGPALPADSEKFIEALKARLKCEEFSVLTF